MADMRPYYTTPTPPRRANRRVREAVAILLILLIAGVAIGGGYWIANGQSLPFHQLFTLGQPTPLPTISPLEALVRIQQIDTRAAVSVNSTISDEVDLVTTNSTDAGSTLTTQQQTQILSLYMRGYSNQTFWRWRDTYTSSNEADIYEVRSGELWVITTRARACSVVWTVYRITPTEIIKRGASSTSDYTQGIDAHPGEGLPPDVANPCG
jgi:hypothetical protein